MKIIRFITLISLPVTVVTPFSISSSSCSCHKSYKVAAPVDNGINIKQTDYSKVFVLAGQSNAVGCSKTEYLKDKISAEEFDYFKSGINKVETSSCIEEEIHTSTFSPTKFDREYFGPEIGFADIMAKRSSEKVYVIKYAVGGTCLDVQWMDSNYNRGKLYNNLIAFIKQEFAKLPNAKICGVCWMQGESDADPIHARKYYENTNKFVSYLRQDLNEITVNNGFVFVDAGISDQWYKWDAINEAKIKYWKTSKLNGYFSTTENGLSTLQEPKDNPDKAHYDSLSELELGRWFALKTIELFNANN